MMNAYDVIIAGNGIVAKAMALALEAIGLNSVRIAPMPSLYDNDPRSYAIAPSSLRLLKNLGVDFSEGEVHPVSGIELGFGEQFNPPLIELARDHSPMMSMIDHNAISRALERKLGKARLIDGMIGQLEAGEFGVKLQEHSLHAPLLLVAEGKRSKTAAKLGISYQRFDYQQLAITAKLKCEIPHDGISRQLFTSTGPLGLLPHGKDEVSIVWSQDQAHARALLELEDDAFLAAVEAAIKPIYGKLSFNAPRASFPLEHLTASRIIGDRFALIGDSAHALHPLAGQGLNLGLRDVACLIDCLREAKMRGEDIGNAATLSQYKNWRKGDISKLTHLTRGLHDFARGSGLIGRAVNRIAHPLLKQNLVRKWLAEMGDAELSPKPKLLSPKTH